jgi:hypothetical protein
MITTITRGDSRLAAEISVDQKAWKAVPFDPR